MPDQKRFHVATAGPVAVVEIDKTRPGTPRTTRNKVTYRLDVFPGTHTAITFRNVEGGSIVSNNPNVVDSGDRETWLEQDLGNGGRRVFFHARATLESKVDTTLFLLDGAPAGSRVLFQVRRVPFPPPTQQAKGRVLIRLNGVSVALNQDDGKIDPYRLTHSIGVKNHEQNVDVFNRMLGALNGASIEHLVINAHGDITPGGAVIQLGDHFHRGNLHIWDKLEGKVRYIWFQACVAAADVEFMQGIASRTGAWVSGVRDVAIPSEQFGPGVIDLTPRVYSHFNAVLDRRGSEGPGIPRSRDLFYRSVVNLHSGSVSFEMPNPK